MKRLLAAPALALILTMSAALPGPALAGAGDSEDARAERWREIKSQIFGERPVKPSAEAVSIDAPKRADDASLVPITLALADKDAVRSLSFIIDDNPTPYAAKFTFGPQADPGRVKLRVRVNSYTDVHAVVEKADGSLLESAAYVKATGGCSAPMGMSDEEAMKGMGDMRMKFANAEGGVEGGEPGPVEATLMIRHPNFSGLQMNQVTRDYTPARFIQKIDVSRGGKLILQVDGDISLSQNPVINFAFKPDGAGPIKVAATDNMGGAWEKTFDVPAPSH